MSSENVATNRLKRGKPAAPAGPNGSSAPLHRLQEVRRREGFTQASMARHLGIPESDVKVQELATTDLAVSVLHRWAAVLKVPAAELLANPADQLSLPVLERARLVRIMKTVLSILDLKSPVRMKRLAKTVVGQLIELMPELRDSRSWNAVGQRRRRDELGRAAFIVLPDALRDEDSSRR
jgi:transcriptional regulator with XRE-family HTH domain